MTVDFNGPAYRPVHECSPYEPFDVAIASSNLRF